MLLRGGLFHVAPALELKKLEAIFRHRVFKMLLAKEKITKEMTVMLSTRRHSGFNVFCGNRISRNDATAMENLARHIIRASFSQERMRHLDQEGSVVYTAKAGKSQQIHLSRSWKRQDTGNAGTRRANHFSASYFDSSCAICNPA